MRAQPSARRPPAARGGSVITEPRGARRPPARKHAAGPGTGKSGGEPQRPQPRHAPALEPPQAARLPPRLSQGPAVSSPPRTSHSESIAGPALGEAPASGQWGFRHHGTSRRQTPTSAQARRRAGNGEERGRTPAPATLPRSRSRAPTSRTASPRLSQGPAVSSPPRSSHSESIAGPPLGTSPASGPWGFRHHGHPTSDKIYKVRPMLDRMLPLFRRYYSPRQQLSLDEGMIPTKNRLAIKQYIRDKPVRWGIKSFLLCEAKTGYILDAEIYTGRVRDRHWPLLGSSGSVVRRLVENSQVTNKNHMLFMDRFYNSVALFHMLKKELGVLAAGTVMPSRKHYPKELGRRLTERGRYEFRCRGALCAIAWKDRKPIHFLSNYHDPRRASTVNRRVGDRLAQLTAPQLVVDYTR